MVSPENPSESHLPKPIADDGSAPAAGQRQLVLDKHGHRYIFRYNVGQETSFLQGLQALANSPDSELNWFDAAVLSHQMGQRLSQDITQFKRA